MDLEQLKAHAYDVIAGLESLQNELKATNEKIAELQKEALDTPVEASVESPAVDETPEAPVE